jgi:methionyl-tRNA formyltransferase
MRILAIGTTSFLESCVKGLMAGGCVIEAIISIPANLLPDNSIDMSDLANSIGVDYFETEDINNEDSLNIIKNIGPDIIFSGWPKMISKELLRIPSIGVIGSHPTALPLNKGRHPLQWQIVLGLTNSKLSFFWMDEGVDSGDLIMQSPYQICLNDTILSLAAKLDEVAFYSSKAIGEILMDSGKLNCAKQENIRTNTWRKRNRHDVLIDFRMNSEKILAIVRSFTLPYPCATFIFESTLFHVVSGEISHLSEPIENIEPGKIFSVATDYIEVKAADKIVKLKTIENVSTIIGTSKYIHPPTKYILKHPTEFGKLFNFL